MNNVKVFLLDPLPELLYFGQEFANARVDALVYAPYIGNCLGKAVQAAGAGGGHEAFMFWRQLGKQVDNIRGMPTAVSFMEIGKQDFHCFNFWS